EWIQNIPYSSRLPGVPGKILDNMDRIREQYERSRSRSQRGRHREAHGNNSPDEAGGPVRYQSGRPADSDIFASEYRIYPGMRGYLQKKPAVPVPVPGDNQGPDVR